MMLLYKKTMSPRKSEEEVMISVWILASIVARKIEEVVLRCSSKYVFIKICEISQEKRCVGVAF